MDQEIEIKCMTCPHTWTVTYSELKNTSKQTIYKSLPAAQTTVEEYMVKCPKDGTDIIVEVEIAEADE